MTAPKGQVLGTGSKKPVPAADWTGITTGHNALCCCPWVWRQADGPGGGLRAEIKRVDRSCVIHGGIRA